MNKALGLRFKVGGYPTLMWMGADGKSYTYEGERNVEKLTEFVEVCGRARARGNAGCPNCLPHSCWSARDGVRARTAVTGRLQGGQGREDPGAVRAVAGRALR